MVVRVKPLLWPALTVLLLAGGTGTALAFPKFDFGGGKAREELEQLKTELEETKRKSQQELEELRNANQGLRDDLRLAREEAAKMREETAAAAPPANGKNGAAAKEAAVKDAQAKLTKKYQGDLAALQEKVAAAERGAAQAQLEVRELKEAAKEKDRKLSELNARVAALTKDDGRYRSQLEALSKELKQLESDAQRLRDSADQARLAAQQAQKQAAKEQQEANKRAASLQKALAQAEGARQKLAAQVQELQAERQDAERMRRELAQANDRIAELIVALDQQENLVDQLQADQNS